MCKPTGLERVAERVVQLAQDSDDQIIREICILASVRPRMQAAGLQCPLRLLFPTRKPVHFPVRSFPGKSGQPKDPVALRRMATAPVLDAGRLQRCAETGRRLSTGERVVRDVGSSTSSN